MSEQRDKVPFEIFANFQGFTHPIHYKGLVKKEKFFLKNLAKIHGK
jgi:hypothetical protein